MCRQARHAHIRRLFGFAPPEPAHLIVNGWYFYGGLNLAGPRFVDKLKQCWTPFAMMRGPLLNFRAAAAVIPPIAHLGFAWATKEWREQLAPSYRALVVAADRAIPSATMPQLVSWIDRLGAIVGCNVASVIGVAGYAAKKELPLAQFWRTHLSGVDGSWLELVRAGDAAAPEGHDVQGLDWFHPTLGELSLDARAPSADARARIITGRDARPPMPSPISRWARSWSPPSPPPPGRPPSYARRPS